MILVTALSYVYLFALHAFNVLNWEIEKQIAAALLLGLSSSMIGLVVSDNDMNKKGSVFLS